MQMVKHNLFAVLLSINVVIIGWRCGVADGLSNEYYTNTCPSAESVVKNVVNIFLQDDAGLAAALVRLHFHDCFVEGCDGSVLIDSTEDNTAEKDAPQNHSIEGFDLIDAAKEELEKQCPGVVSCADIVALAARDAVSFAGGPVYDIPKGRKDGRISKFENAISSLPSVRMNSSGLVAFFAQRGFTAQEMVALSGAHTLGAARCVTFKNRLSNFDAINNMDPNLDPQFAMSLLETCSAGDDAEQSFDSTRNTFDNEYFKALERNSGVLFTDESLFAGDETRATVTDYATNQTTFFLDFQQAVIKMGMLGVKEDSSGEVRVNCRKIN